MTLIIGIDPGIKYTGWGVIKADDLQFIAGNYIETNAKHTFEERLYNIYAKLIKIIDEYSPTLFAIEKIFININPKSSIVLSQTRGALLLTAKIKDLQIFQYDANVIKKAITGNGHATKEQIKYMVNSLLKCNIECKKYDLYDALAIAICCAHRYKFATLS